jgi:ribosomal protein S18 acetylase RimI-like enzyme
VTLPDGWTSATPGTPDVPGLTELLRRHEEDGRGWASTSPTAVLLDVTADPTRSNVVVRDADGALRGWASAHDRAAGRMLLAVVVDRRLADAPADEVAGWLFGWGDDAARRVGAARSLQRQQIDSGAFADDDSQHRWLQRAGFEKVRTWWQMSRPVAPHEAGPVETRPGVRIRRVAGDDERMPDETDLRTVHDVLEGAFADHFNSHEETFDEFLSRLRMDPGHRWDHWWVAEITDGPEPRPAGALVASVSSGPEGGPEGSYVDYIGVQAFARGRGVASALLRTVIADAAARGRDRVGLEVDADSPTGAEGLYTSMGWATGYVTDSWHRTVPVQGER